MTNNFYFLTGTGEAARQIREIDWASTPLGPPEAWPWPLKTAVQMMLASHFPKAMVWGSEYITLYNDAFKPILGDKKDCMGRSFKAIWEEAWTDIGPIVEKAYGGEATYINDFPLVINRYGYDEQCYFTFCYSPILTEDGKVGGMMDTVMETTNKVEAEKSATILNSELAHRIKNTFGMVQAIAAQTFRDSESREEVARFERRLFALSGAHDILLEGESVSGGQLSEIIKGAAKALSLEDQIDCRGPTVIIGAKSALAASLLMHELMTNAVKYGALSVPQGRVFIDWHIVSEQEPALVLRWREEGGPQVVPPTRKGFGSKLIRMGLAGTGSVNASYPPEGFEVEMTAPLNQIQAQGRLHRTVVRAG